MAQYVFQTSSRFFTTAGTATVEQDGVAVARVESRSGGFFKGPSWSFDGLDLSWTMQAAALGEAYDLVGVDGRPVGSITGRIFSSDLSLVTADNQTATLPGAALLSSGRDRELRLGHGLRGSIVRETRGLAAMFSSSEVWRLDLPDDVMGQLRAVCLALPMVLDHQRREDAASD